MNVAIGVKPLTSDNFTLQVKGYPLYPNTNNNGLVLSIKSKLVLMLLYGPWNALCNVEDPDLINLEFVILIVTGLLECTKFPDISSVSVPSNVESISIFGLIVIVVLPEESRVNIDGAINDTGKEFRSSIAAVPLAIH